jgi:hypothetical protein
MTGTLLMPPATAINYSSWAVTGFVFQYWIRRHHFRVGVLPFVPFIFTDAFVSGGADTTTYCPRLWTPV